MPHRIPRRRLVRRARMHRIASILAIILSLPFQFLWLAIPLRATAATNIMIEEVAWAGSSRSTTDEWIELANLGDTTTTIAGWILKGAGTSDRDIIFPEGAEITPNGTYLISNYAESDEKTNVIGPIQMATTTISLSNSQLGIRLFNTDQILIDQAGDGKTPAAGSTNPYASMIRTDAMIAGDQANAWTTATSSSGFKEGSTELGTPRFCDLCVKSGTRDSGIGSTTPIENDSPSTQTTSSTIDTTLSNSTSSTTNEININSTSSTDDGLQTTNELAEIPPTATDTDTDTSSNATTQQTAYATLFLNEAVSNPATGSEWVELQFPNGTTSTDRELFLYDGQGKIATIATGTILTASPYLVIYLSSSRLNNGGDGLSVRESDGTVADETTIPALEKGESWARNPEGDAWEITETLTPASENSLYRAPTKTNVTSSNATSILTQTVTTALTTTKAAPISVSLNEAVSNPNSGPEWVELYISADVTSTDRILVLHDSKSAIKTIPAHTSLTLPHYLVIALSGARLTNSGEALSLTESDGTLIEATSIPKLDKGSSWAKATDGSWEISETLTPAEQNRFSASEKKEMPNSKTTSTSAVVSTTTTESTAIEATPDTLHEIFNAATASNTSDKSSPVKKSTTSKTSSLVIPYAFSDMFSDTVNGARVRVTGTVASIPKLFGASHVFILENEDGRGVVVYVPTHLHIPDFGSTVRVDGTISATDYGPQLKMKTTDIWMSMTTSTPPQPRTVDLLAPGAEDAWSLVTIQGTVANVGTASFTIETDDAITVTILAPTVVGFRTKRLIKGDVVQVTGLLDIKKQSPTIILRVPEDVSIMKHAPDTVTTPAAASTQTKSGIPNWVPFASAGIAIVGTGGAKRLKELMKKRKLKRLMEKNGNRDI